MSRVWQDRFDVISWQTAVELIKRTIFMIFRNSKFSNVEIWKYPIQNIHLFRDRYSIHRIFVFSHSNIFLSHR